MDPKYEMEGASMCPIPRPDFPTDTCKLPEGHTQYHEACGFYDKLGFYGWKSMCDPMKCSKRAGHPGPHDSPREVGT